MSEDISLYKVISSRSDGDGTYESFYKKVSDLMRQGWRCQGGVSAVRFLYTSRDDDDLVEWVYTQALIHNHDGKKLA